jgi:hypothetical protein
VTLRTLIVAGTYASFVSLLSLGGSWGLPLAAAPFTSVEAPGATGAVSDSSWLPASAGRTSEQPELFRLKAEATCSAPDDQTALPVRAARVERRDASQDLERAATAIVAADPGRVWLAWTVPTVRGPRDGMGRNGHRIGDGGCVLDEDGHFENGSATTGDTTRLVVLARRQGGVFDRLTFTDARCTVQAGNRTVYWLDGVRPADSVTWAARLIEDGAGRDPGDARLPAGRDRDRHDRVRSAALALIALTDDASADRMLEGFAAPDRPSELRRDAAFWLGAARAAPGAVIVDRLAHSDRDERFREHLMFVLTLTGERGLERLFDRARNDESPQVRGQALFWIGQKAGERAVGALARAIEDDPDVEVRTRAVFAISQLPNDEAVPKLIALAESHRDREVRKQAMFWLGQSGDPRALTFFEQVLRR